LPVNVSDLKPSISAADQLDHRLCLNTTLRIIVEVCKDGD
jgi:hypothetical protein